MLGSTRRTVSGFSIMRHGFRNSFMYLSFANVYWWERQESMSGASITCHEYKPVLMYILFLSLEILYHAPILWYKFCRIKLEEFKIMQLIVFSFSCNDLLIKSFGKTPDISTSGCGKWLGLRNLSMHVSKLVRWTVIESFLGDCM